MSYLCSDVVERWRADDGETDEEYIGLRIGEGSETVVILLASRIPQAQADGLAINHDTGGVVVKARMMGQLSARGEEGCSSDLHSRDILAGEGIGGIRDKETSLRRVSCE